MTAAHSAGVPKPWEIRLKWVKQLWIPGSRMGCGREFPSGERSWDSRSVNSLQTCLNREENELVGVHASQQQYIIMIKKTMKLGWLRFEINLCCTVYIFGARDQPWQSSPVSLCKISLFSFSTFLSGLKLCLLCLEKLALSTWLQKMGKCPAATNRCKLTSELSGSFFVCLFGLMKINK